MLKNIKKVILKTTLCMVLLCLPTYTYASEILDYYSIESERLSEMSGASIYDIEQAKEYYGQEKFNENFDYLMNSLVNEESLNDNLNKITLFDAETGKIEILYENSRISDKAFNFMKEKFKPGQILVTKDSGIGPVNFGHSAILVSKNSTVEHLGKNTTDRSGVYDVDWWQGLKTIRSLDYPNSNVMEKAANYALRNLKGLEYNVFSDRYDAKVNCATLVWKAYISQGVNIDDKSSGIVTPYGLDTSSKLNWVRAVNWETIDWM